MIASHPAGAATLIANDNIDGMDVHVRVGAATIFYSGTFAHATSANGIALAPGTDLTMTLPPGRHLAGGAAVPFSVGIENFIQP